MNAQEVRAIRLIVAIAEAQEVIHVRRQSVILKKHGETVHIVTQKVLIELQIGHAQHVEQAIQVNGAQVVITRIGVRGRIILMIHVHHVMVQEKEIQLLNHARMVVQVHIRLHVVLVVEAVQ